MECKKSVFLVDFNILNLFKIACIDHKTFESEENMI